MSLDLLQRWVRKGAQALGHDTALVRGLRPAYASLLSLLAAGRGIPWEINGAPFRIDPGQRHRMGRCYDASVADFLRARVRPGQLCVDVGANVGVYVLQLARWCSPGGRVVAFEPNPDARTVLARHLRMNDLEGLVEVIPAAAGAAAGEMPLFAAGEDGMARLGSPSSALEGRTRVVTVPVVRLDDRFPPEVPQPDWLVMDVEGHELEALEGARALIARRGAALGIVVEMHPSEWGPAGKERAQALLTRLDLRALALTGQGDPLAEYGIVCLEHP